ncbi:hypothetical protein QZH41_007480 [Actinostola sp. cb2023]|nr:hypothetical protein QZH41_007480 [Actinostola sp. cb2023]
MQDALSEEMKLKKVLTEKEARLKEFQSQVQSRVRMLERMKRQEQLGKSVEAVEIVRNIVHQSSFPRVVPSRKSGLAKQDTCSYRDGQDQPIMRPITRGILAHSHEAVDKASQLLEEHAKEIRLSNKYARSVLKSRAATEDDATLDDLPGGRWKPSVLALPKQLYEKENLPEKHEVKDSQENGLQGDYWMGPHEIKDVTDPGDKEECKAEDSGLPQWLAEEDQKKVTIFNPAMINGHKPNKRVTFADGRLDNMKRENERERINIRGNGKLLRTKAIEDLLKPGKVAEDFKQQQKCQMALYRKLFMDIEREQVRENIRMKEHRKRMAEIKVEKEINRLEVEHQYKHILAQEEQQILDDRQEQQRIEEEENKVNHKYVEQKHAKLQKSKESERFMEAMKAVLKDKMKVKGIKVPALCACGLSVWDANPDTCANNCIYYKNPREYAKALSSLLSSLDT